MGRALAILTDQQRDLWQQMTGEPYTGPRLMLFPGPPPGPMPRPFGPGGPNR